MRKNHGPPPEPERKKINPIDEQLYKHCENLSKERDKDDYTIKDSGQRREFGTGAVRDMAKGKGRFDLLPWAVIRAVAIHYQKGCEKYGDRNWEKGIPVKSFLDSAIRHAAQVIDGRNDENHAVAALWNMACAYQTILWIQEGKLPLELYDIPRKVVLPDPYGNYHFKNWEEVEKKWGKKWKQKELRR